MSFSDRVLIIGHRGAAGLSPENTLPSFRRAWALGVNAVELDVHLVEDELVVIHDDTLERTTNGQGPVAGRSLAALRGLDAGGGWPIPLLREVVAALPAGAGLNVELKGTGTAAAGGFLHPLRGDRAPGQVHRPGAELGGRLPDVVPPAVVQRRHRHVRSEIVKAHQRVMVER